MIFKVYNLFIINKVQKTQDPAALRCFLRSAARQRRTICKREKLGGYMRNGKGWKSEFALQQLAQQVQLHESQNRHQKRQHHRQAIEVAVLTSVSAINTAATTAATTIPV